MDETLTSSLGQCIYVPSHLICKADALLGYLECLLLWEQKLEQNIELEKKRFWPLMWSASTLCVVLLIYSPFGPHKLILF